MLTHIHIRDFAIIDELELELRGGMTALTGETGAGKSILVDALGLVLGDRADSTAIRQGAERAEISVGFEIEGLSELGVWLEEQDLSADGECVLRRVITAEGRSRGFVNGRGVPMQTLKELGPFLVDIHGQHEHQSLVHRATQLALVDGYGGHAAQLEEVARLYRTWRKQADALTELRERSAAREERLDVLRFQVRELDILGLGTDELENLDGEHQRLAHGERLISGAQRALSRAYEDDSSAQALLSDAQRELEELAKLDASLAPIRDGLQSALVNLEEAADDLQRYLAGLDLDPQRLAWVEQRLGSIHEMSRKHRVEPAALPGLLETLQQELGTLEDADVAIAGLEEKVAQMEVDYLNAAKRLSDARGKSAARLGKQVSAVMQDLGMPGGRLMVEISQADPPRPSPRGMDRVEFQVSANAGQALLPLAKVASGGELSRISLSIQVVAAQATAIPSMIFDEVDSGIGGGVAEIVGRRLRELGDDRQVLCVTHLPQVASQAHHQLRVSKETGSGQTRTRIEELTGKERVEELARMLGGVEITATTRKHAREMIAKAGS